MIGAVRTLFLPVTLTLSPDEILHLLYIKEERKEKQYVCVRASVFWVQRRLECHVQCPLGA